MNPIVLIITTCFCLCSCQQEHNDGSAELQKKVQEEKLIKNEVGGDEKVIQFNDSIRCNIHLIVKLSNKMDNPTDNDILNFLYTFDESCKNNAEYSEFSNEILFECLYKHPEQLLKLLSYKNINTQLILKELKTPVNDKYNTEDIIRKVDKASESELKNEVIRALRNQ